MCLFTRYVRAVLIPDEKAETLAQALLNHWISIFGPKKSLLSDRGPSFTGTVIDSLAERMSIKQLTALPLHPQAIGVAE